MRRPHHDPVQAADRTYANGRTSETMMTQNTTIRHRSDDTERTNDRSQSGQSGDTVSVDQVLSDLRVDPKQGLTGSEAEERLNQHGPNAIEEEERSTIVKLLSHFWGPIPWMIEVATILALVAQRWEDVGVIFTMLLINGGVGFWHESKADRAIKALKEQMAPQADVLRDGETTTVEAWQLVPGDVVHLHMGDIVPADVLLLHDQHVSIDESALTGESLPVSKEQGDACYSGTSVKRGDARAVVTATGRDTKFARTVELVESAEEAAHFRKAVLRIGYVLIGSTAVLVAIIVAFSIIVRSDPWTQVLLFALGLTLAGIPQALPAVLSVTMSVGANRLARMKAIVSRLPAMEEIAGLEVLCADKTGTLTKNELELQQPVVFGDVQEQDVVVAAALTTNRERRDDPIDNAVLGGLEDESVLDDYTIDDFEGFDPTRKRAEAHVCQNGTSFRVAKGAPQVILDLVDADPDQRQQITNKVDQLGRDGFRTLGVARNDNDGAWIYLGLLPLLDPPRDDAADVLRDARDHGIDIRMVTGDHVAIGRQVAGQVGLGDNFVEASELFGAAEEAEQEREQTREDIRETVLQADGFAGVTPEHKFRIVKHFQAGDRIVGMTGDGVNDAPALKQADIGIAVSGATDAARAASDLILTEKGLGVITHAIEEARRIFERMTGYATFRITESMRVLLFVSIAILAFNVYPVTPIMIVLLAILNDIPIMTIAWDKVPTAGHPVRWDMPRVLSVAAVLSVAGVASSFLFFWYARAQLGLPMAQLQTMFFLKLLVAGHMTIFLTRNDRWLWSKPWPSWSLFLALEGTQIVGTLFAVYGVLVEPIGWELALMVWGYALVWLFLLNFAKVATLTLINRYRNQGSQHGNADLQTAVAQT